MTTNWENRSKGHTYQITSKWKDLEAGINGLKFFLARSFETMKGIEERSKLLQHTRATKELGLKCDIFTHINIDLLHYVPQATFRS